MADVVRTGTIVINLETGTVRLPAPSMDPINRAKERTIQLDRQIAESQKVVLTETEKLFVAREKAAAAETRASTGMQSSLRETGEGFFRLGRAAVLLGADSDESFQTMIRGLARVQAGFDLFKGTSQIVTGLTLALQKARDAEIQMAIATGQATTAAEAQAAGFGSAAAGASSLARSLVGSLATMAAIAAVIYVVSTAWDALTTSEQETAEAEELVKKRIEETTRSLERQAQAAREVAEIRRDAMTDNEKVSALRQSQNDIPGLENAVSRVIQRGGPAEAASLNLQREAAKNLASDLQEYRQAQRQVVEEQLRSLEVQKDQIESQQKLVEAAEKQLKVEQEKVKQFQAGVGAASAGEQQRLREIRDRLKAGQDISNFDEEFLEKIGGESGRSIVETRRAKRGEAAGFGADFFDGIEGASTGLKDASKALADAIAKLKELTGGADAVAAVASLEQKKKALQDQLEKFYVQTGTQLNRVASIMETVDARLSAIEQAARIGTK